MKDFFINVIEESEYPSSDYFFSPDQVYPEYLWGKEYISKERNYVYEMVRNCLIGLELDKNNIGNSCWNPFSGIININDTIVVKPNWVYHRNKNRQVKNGSFECLVTHPSIVRAIVDYVLIALDGTGKVIIGDAPMQGCNLERLLKDSGYENLFSFYSKLQVDVQKKDFRNYSSIVNSSGVIIDKIYNGTEYIEVDVGDKSKHYNTNCTGREYKVSDYSKKETTECHSGGIHKYFIAKDVLSADVVINISKPKCHRLTGITAALKNIVGITYDKVCLPHRVIGSTQEIGDEYLKKNILKRVMARLQETQVFFETKKRFIPSLTVRYLYLFLYFLVHLFSKDKYLLGSWYGNDTVWRTVCDLNYILQYADKHGNLQNRIQRKVFNFADMIVAGEGNGPVSPEPKHLGLIIAGNNSAMMDLLVCEIMGFDRNKVPGLNQALNSVEASNMKPEEYILASNKNEYQNRNINDLVFPVTWHFKPYDTWQGRIEK